MAWNLSIYLDSHVARDSISPPIAVTELAAEREFSIKFSRYVNRRTAFERGGADNSGNPVEGFSHARISETTNIRRRDNHSCGICDLDRGGPCRRFVVAGRVCSVFLSRLHPSHRSKKTVRRLIVRLFLGA